MLEIIWEKSSCRGKKSNDYRLIWNDGDEKLGTAEIGLTRHCCN
jgi:hypothetical protein